MPAPWITNSPAGLTYVGANPYWAFGPSSRCAEGFVISSTDYAVYAQSDVQPSRTSGAAGCNRKLATFASGNTMISCLNSTGVEVLRIQSTAANQYRLEYWDGAAWVAASNSVAVPSSTVAYRYAIQFSGLGTASGSLRLRIVRDDNENVFIDETTSGLDLSAISNVAQLRMYAHSTSNSYTLGEAFIKDGNVDAVYGYINAVNAEGTDSTDGTGAFGAINEGETTTPDVDLISLPTSGNKRSFRCASRNFSGRYVKTVSVEVRLRCGATGPQQFRPYLLISGTRYYHPSSPVTLTTNFTNYQFLWENDPSTAGAWGPANAESSTLEWGIEAV